MQSSSDRRRADQVAGRRVLITGGSSGIGLACARDLTARGAHVALVARGDDGLARAAASIQPPPATFAADVTDVDALRAAVARAADVLGGLDAVVANAGAAAYGPFADMSPDDYRRTIDVTLLGTLNTAHVALPHLDRSAGTLVVVGSIAGRVPTPWLAGYTAAKHGVRGFVRALSAELRAQRSPVKLALVAPGPVDTPFWRRARATDGRLPPRLFGSYRPEDVAQEVARSLVSPRIERTVGGAMAAAAVLDALAPRATLRLIGVGAKLSWRRRQRRPRTADDALSQPVTEPHLRAGLPARRSVLASLRDVARVNR